MKIAIFGVTGGTGRALAEQALAAGHEVRALVRTPGSLGELHEQIEVVEGDVLDQSAVDRVIRGADAVAISLGSTKNNPDNVVSEGTRRIIDAMEREGLRRVVAVTSLGVGDSRDQVPLAFKVIARTILRGAMEDKERQEELLRTSDLDWIIARPGGLTNGPRSGSYTRSTDGEVKAGQISRADVADFILQELVEPTHLRQAVAIT